MKKWGSLVVCLALTLSLTVGTASAFTDQGSIRYGEAVSRCVELNIISGYGDGSYRPQSNVTRGELCKMLSVALNGGREPALNGGGSIFTDTQTHWAMPYVAYCAGQDIVAGVGGGRFEPDGRVTGTQAAKMLLVILGFDPGVQGYVGSSLWAEHINEDAADMGLYDGLGSFDASAPLTRDQAAQMIWNGLNSNLVTWKEAGGTVHIEALDKTLLAQCYPNGAPPVSPAPGKVMTLSDYVGMTRSEIARMWGSDYTEVQGGEMGAESLLCYEDGRMPAEFSLNGGTVVVLFCSPKTMGSDFTLTDTLTGKETYAQLLAKGISGDFVSEDNDPNDTLGWNYLETAAFSFHYEGRYIYFSWLNEDPYTAMANFIFIA